jgi:agmatine/peptidylarginine deiminase
MAIVLPSEWTRQSAVMLTWPHEETDWNYILDDVTKCYISIAHEIAKRENLLIVCRDEQKVRSLLEDIQDKITFCSVETNDTWARDHGPISLFVEGEPVIYDFQFNGWGLKFASNYDNQITRRLYDGGIFSPQVGYYNMLHYVLEGGSIESDGEGTLMTTSECLLSPNRNQLSREEVEEYLKNIFGLKRVLWLDNGYLAGDDTDSHVDTLARFCSVDTIAYVKCEDENDEHFEELQLMEEELKNFRQLNGEPYKLVPLPMPTAQFEDDFRLPATYANFLIINEAVLVPIYNCPEDSIALERLKTAFPDREIVGIDCSVLIRQHGSLHCVTMQLPENVF